MFEWIVIGSVVLLLLYIWTRVGNAPPPGVVAPTAGDLTPRAFYPSSSSSSSYTNTSGQTPRASYPKISSPPSYSKTSGVTPRPSYPKIVSPPSYTNAPPPGAVPEQRTDTSGQTPRASYTKIVSSPPSYNKSYITCAAADVLQSNKRQASRYGLSDAEWVGGRQYRTDKGDLVRSPGEVRVANHLWARGHRYEYEAMICGWRPDFFLYDYGIVIEYWSSMSPNRQVKSESYIKAGYALLDLEHNVQSHLLESTLDRLIVQILSQGRK